MRWTAYRRRKSQDHPCSRGNHRQPTMTDQHHEGSPPLTREPPLFHFLIISSCRITPAHAGTTAAIALVKSLFRDHPRSRGNHIYSARSDWKSPGSPPLTREPLSARSRQSARGRITPAHAGTTAKDPLKIPAFHQSSSCFYSLSPASIYCNLTNSFRSSHYITDLSISHLPVPCVVPPYLSHIPSVWCSVCNLSGTCCVFLHQIRSLIMYWRKRSIRKSLVKKCDIESYVITDQF